MKKIGAIFGIILVCEVILYLFSPIKKGFGDRTNMELWYIATLLGCGCAIAIVARKWDVSEKLFYGLMFVIYLLAHYWDYL